MTAPPTHGLDLDDLVVRTAAQLAGELRAGAPAPALSPRTVLDRDLGLDSLAKVELLARLERASGVRLPDRAGVEAKTLGDLARALRDAAARAPLSARSLEPVAMPPAAPDDLPRAAETLQEVLAWHAERHPERTQIWLYDDEEAVRELSFGHLADTAARVAGALAERGVEPRQAVGIMLPTSEEFFAAFFGVLAAGAVPVPLYPPVRPSQLTEHVRRQAAILRTAEAPYLITVPEAKPVARYLCAEVPGLRGMLTADELRSADPLAARPRVSPEDTAFLQFTSGSTGDPKGVVLSHANLLANLRVIGEAVGPTPEDVFVSWLPLYHDMGLIGAVLCTLYHAVPLVLMSPLAFLRRPERWLRALHRHRGTLSAAPNFAYELCVKKVPDEALAELDLSAWRMTLNGAEPISPDTLRRFRERFAPCGFRGQAMTPTYGLAECSLGLAMSPLDREPRIDRVDRERFSRSGEAVPCDRPDALAFVSCGAPLRGHEVRVVDEAGRELPERREGRLQFRGPSATSGYLRNPTATAALVREDGWLDSGDRAYVAGGELYLTGREKDVILRAGRNLYPHELEERVGELPGVRKGCVAVFGARDPAQGTEALVVLAETRERDPEARERLRARIRAASLDLLGTPPDDVVLAPPHTVLKTSSGKVRRAACRALYEEGKLLERPLPVWLQLARMSLRGAAHGLRERARRVGELAYAARFWGVFGLHWGGCWALVVLLPGRKRRWRVARRAARAFFRAAGSRLRVRGAERLDALEPPYVVVSNHQSYLDGALLAAVLPPDAAFAVKRELREFAPVRLLLERLGAVFVDRAGGADGVASAEALQEALAAGRALVVFPEGTCLRRPGLLPFRLGAFHAASAAGVPVVPVTVRGTRDLLRPDQWFPRRADVEVEVGEALRPEGEGNFEAALALRDRARAAVLAACGEPDLDGEAVRLG
ncbi:MAG: acyl-phosphate glycerol 3-phosphate acyltransferase [Planctomycetota bacterium]|nr:MAG: acyl-phosphate glycerol 3-phosphate acyltransferase [Planctomycetota bacterium]